MSNLILRFGTWLRVIVLAAFLVFLTLAPALLGIKVMGTDSLELLIPQLAFYKHAFTSGESPFWNPYLAVGFPNFISVAGFPYAPLHFLLYILPAHLAHYWALFLSLALGALFFILFLRELGLGPWAAFIGSLAYLAGNIHFARDLTLGTALFVYPTLFWILIRIHKSTSARARSLYIFSGGFLIGYAWLMSSYFPTLYLFCAALAFVLFLGIRSADWRHSAKLSTALLVIFAVGTIIGSLQLVPAYVITQFSQRSQGFAEPAVQDGYAITFRELLHFFFLTSYRGLDAYLYMGMVPLLLIALAFFKKNSAAIFFLGVFLVSLAISIKGSPLFWWIIVKLPVFNFFQGAARFMLIGIFASAVLIGLGADYLETAFRSAKPDKWKIIISFITLTIFIFLMAALFSGEDGVPQAVMISGVFLIAAVGAVIFCLAEVSRNALVLPLLSVIAAVEFVTISYRFNVKTIFDASYYRTPPTDAELFIASKNRILPLFVEDWDGVYFFNFPKQKDLPPEFLEYRIRHASYHPNTQFLWPVANLEANEPLLNVSMGRMMALLGTRQLVTAGGEEKLNKIYKKSADGTDVSVKEKYELFKERLPLTDFLGIRYFLSSSHFENRTLYSPIKLPLRGYRFLDIGGPSEQPMPIFVFENPNAKPLVYFGKVTGFKNNSEEAYQAFKESGFRDIFVECSGCGSKELNGEGKVEIVLAENGRVSANTSSETEGFMVFTQNHLPGWRASIDGEESEIYKVNSVFPGIFVPAGDHQVEFIYDYWSLFDPKLVAGLIFSKN